MEEIRNSDENREPATFSLWQLIVSVFLLCIALGVLRLIHDYAELFEVAFRWGLVLIPLWWTILILLFCPQRRDDHLQT